MKPAEIESAFVAGRDAPENATCPHHPATLAAHWWTRGFAYTHRALTAERRCIGEAITARQLALQGLAEALAVVLDQVDYTHGACKVVEMVGAVLPKQIIAKARAALDAAKPFSK